MVDLLEIAAFRAADELASALEHAVSGAPTGDALAADLRATSVEVLAQSIYLGPGARPEQRLEAYDRLRRATRRVAILVDVARVRGQLPPAAARGLLLTNAALWHEVRRGDRRERRERAADRGAAVAPRPQPVASPARAGSSFDSEDDTRPDPLPRVAPTLILRAGR